MSALPKYIVYKGIEVLKVLFQVTRDIGHINKTCCSRTERKSTHKGNFHL